MPVTTVRTRRLTLSAFQPDDAPIVTRHLQDYDVAGMLARVPWPYTRADAERWIDLHEPEYQAGKAAVWAVRPSVGEPLIGAVGLYFQPEHERSELGYWLGKPWWGSGIMTEAAGGILDHALGTLRLQRVWATHIAENAASARVLEKIGMTREGVLRQHIRRDGRFHDSVQWGILRSEWLNRKGTA